MQRIGVYGGTFDPIHIGHLIIAEHAREQLELDRVFFVPSGNPPHKASDRISSARQRLEMVQLAIAGNADFALCDFEVRRETVSFTVDTLRHLSESQADAELFLLLGADNLHDLPRWRQPKEIAALAHLCFAGRPGIQLDFSVLNDILSSEHAQDVRTHQLTAPLLEISSTQIRRRVSEGKSVRYLVPPPVHAYIQTEKLYQQ